MKALPSLNFSKCSQVLSRATSNGNNYFSLERTAVCKSDFITTLIGQNINMVNHHIVKRIFFNIILLPFIWFVILQRSCMWVILTVYVLNTWNNYFKNVDWVVTNNTWASQRKPQANYCCGLPDWLFSYKTINS